MLSYKSPITNGPFNGPVSHVTFTWDVKDYEGAWIVRFIMPKGSTVETLPAPNDSRVKLLTIPASRIALVRFSGLTQPKDVQKRTRELESFLDARKYRALDAPALARFDPPWTLWFMRRNEIWVPIARDAAE